MLAPSVWQAWAVVSQQVPLGHWVLFVQGSAATQVGFAQRKPSMQSVSAAHEETQPFRFFEQRRFPAHGAFEEAHVPFPSQA